MPTASRSCSDRIQLNSGLVSIIGPKGSGKSALAELIAFAAGSQTGAEKSSFISRAAPHITGLHVELEWGDQRKSDATFPRDVHETNEVRYLSQSFVERLCSEDHVGTELVQEIESVIFAHLDPTDTLNSSSFAELRDIRTERTQADRRTLRAEIQELILEDQSLRSNLSGVPAKRARLEALSKEREELQKQLPSAANEEEARLQRSMQKLRTALALLQNEAAHDKQLLVRIEALRSQIAAFSKEVNRFNTEIEAAVWGTGIPPEYHHAFRVAFSGDTNAPLDSRTAQLKKQISNRDGEPGAPATGTILRLQQEIKTLEGQVTADLARRDKTQGIQRRIAAIASEIQRIESEIWVIEGPERQRLTGLRYERMDAYLGHFRSLQEEQQIPEELYRPVTARLASGTEHEKSLDFLLRWEVDWNTWLERGGDLFDQRKTQPFGNLGGLISEIQKQLIPGWQTGNLELIRQGMTRLLRTFYAAKPATFLKANVTLSQLLEWLFQVDHIRLTYGLRYNGVELEKLSPGTKGIVLLILYLGMDREDTRPLVIDQPEENLDSESIYDLLASYFKSAKSYRQVLLITHNPNLVVNTDADQVVVSQACRRVGGLPTMRYATGSLENVAPALPGIREQVCRILEGGATAFLKRERRYALSE